MLSRWRSVSESPPALEVRDWPLPQAASKTRAIVSWGARIGPPMVALVICRVAACCAPTRSEEHTSELQSLAYLVCRLLLEKKKNCRTNYRSCGHHGRASKRALRPTQVPHAHPTVGCEYGAPSTYAGRQQPSVMAADTRTVI